MAVPKHHELFNLVLRAIKALGGSATNAELDEEVTKHLGLTEDEIAEPHNERMTELEYRLAWTRTYLKINGLLEGVS
jgi:restriction system protein